MAPDPANFNPNTHGTGCTLSSAIACGLAAGCSLEESVRRPRTTSPAHCPPDWT